MVKKFNLKNKYIVKSNFNVNKNVSDELVNFYLPIIGVESFALYMFLSKEILNSFLKNNYIYSNRIVECLGIK